MGYCLCARTAILRFGVHLSVFVALHGQDGAAKRPDARDVLDAAAALALGGNARRFRADAGCADNDSRNLALEDHRRPNVGA